MSSGNDFLKMLGLDDGTKNDALDAVRLEMSKAFEQIDTLVDNADALELARIAVYTNVALGSMISVLEHAPSGGAFASYVYPKAEALEVIREELMRKLNGGVA